MRKVATANRGLQDRHLKTTQKWNEPAKAEEKQKRLRKKSVERVMEDTKKKGLWNEDADWSSV